MNLPFVLIDFSNIVYACFHSSLHQNGLTPESPIPAGYDSHLMHLDMKVGGICNALQVPATSLVMVKDQYPKEKHELYPEYKQNRKTMTFNPKHSAEDWLRAKGCPFVLSPEKEADDVIATLTAWHSMEHKVIVVTGDKDLWQILNHPNTYIYNHHTKEYIGYEKIEKAFGVSDPAHIRLVKALWGDSGDNIPNAVPRMQKALIPIIQSTTGDLNEFYEKAEQADLSKRCRELLTESRKQVEINWSLAGLQYNCPLVWS
jgi:5'-3' exonuclease